MPIKAAEQSLTLYESEGYLAELIDTEGVVTPEMQESFELELRQALSAAQDKRERVAQFILSMESQAQFAKDEAKRIRARGEQFERVAGRVREYVLNYIMSKGLDASARFPKLTGKTVTMSARSNPASVEIQNADEVPVRFKKACIEMPLDLWQVLVDAFPSDTAGALKSVEIDKRAVKAAMDKGENVAGADLNIGKYSLQVR